MSDSLSHSCPTCKRTPGRVRMVQGQVVSDALGWLRSESSECPDCYEGYPKTAVERAAKELEKVFEDWKSALAAIKAFHDERSEG